MTLLGPGSFELSTGFETTYLPLHNRDVAETTGHDTRWRDDLALVAATGVRVVRYPVRWHRVEQHPGELDWRATDEVLSHLRARGLRPIVDLVHHTSYPRWLTDGFADPRFPEAYLAYVEAFCRRYPWVEAYTLFNEPFSTLFLCTHEGIWPPYQRGIESFVRACRNVLPALVPATRLARRLLPQALHVWVDTGEHHDGGDAGGRAYAALANDRRFFLLDVVLGRVDDGFRRPFARLALRHHGSRLLDLGEGCVDVVGLDYYAHNQWWFGQGSGRVPTPTPVPLDELLAEYADRYRRPVMVTETNIRGSGSDRASWFRYVLERTERARAAGVDVRGLCWFPFIDSADWDSLLYRCEGNIDPVGVLGVDHRLRRGRTTLTDAFAAAARGARAADLPAYRFQPPVADWLHGYRPQMGHWPWVEPPPHDCVPDPVLYDMELKIRDLR